MNSPSFGETIDYVARAKALMKKTACAGALVIVPLAVAANAAASVILPTSTVSCSMNTGLGSGSCAAADAQTATTNGLEGVKMYTTGLSGAYGEVGVSGSMSGIASVTFDLSGQLGFDGSGITCTPGGTCDLQPFLFSYLIGATSVANSGGVGGNFTTVTFDPFYNLTATLDGSSFYTATNAATTVSGAQSILSGSALIAIPTEFQDKVADLMVGGSGSHSFDLLVTASIGWSYSGSLQTSSASQIQFQVPPSSIDLVSSAPEPGTTALMLGGLLSIAGWFRRRKRA